MAASDNRQDPYRQSNNGTYTLAQLLDEKRPFDQLIRVKDPDLEKPDSPILQRIQGSLVGLAVGDALGAPVEFRPNAYLKEHPVEDMQSGGTWGLQAGQWTDDTSMALCLAASLIIKRGFNAYDQFERYRRWYKDGYMSSTGKCFDIGKSTRQAITEFENRRDKARRELFAENHKPNDQYFDAMVERRIAGEDNNLRFGASDSAGNGALMRLAPIPCFFQSYDDVKKYVAEATQLTHGDQRAIDACRFYAGLIWHAVNGRSKAELLHEDFYRDTLKLSLQNDILAIAQGSYKKKKNGYEDGIRGKGYSVNALEAALWAFDNDKDDFKTGVLLAVNLGDDTDTTAAIYGQLAGAVYGINNIPKHWVDQLFKVEFIKAVAKGLYTTGGNSENRQQEKPAANSTSNPPEHRNKADSSRQDQQKGANSASNSRKPAEVIPEEQ
jgi:ADP-ribosyl-[dinitrogen reductase] hydrolase